MKRAFIITGPQSSGNHLMTSVFLANKCKGEIGVNQDLDRWINDEHKNIVWRGSMPKGGIGWYDIVEYYNKFIVNNYTPYIIIILRDWFCTANSQVLKYNNIGNVQESIEEIKLANIEIFRHMQKISNFVVITYESLIYQPKETLFGLSKIIDFDLINIPEIRNENRKWYENI